jgi:hypothetical protein
MSAELNETVIAAWLKRSREAQGLPERIADASILARVVVLALAPSAEHNGKGGGAGGGGP